MKKTVFIVAIIFNAIVATISWAAQPYIASDAVPPLLLQTPPSEDSPETAEELKIIVEIQQHADQKEVEQAAQERNFSPELIVLSVRPELNRDQHPALYHLLDRSEETTEAISEACKHYFHTRRPYLLGKGVKALIKAHDSPAYPSGHTAGSYVMAGVLTLLDPAHHEDWEKRAEAVAYHRVLAGMHFPHDLAGGQHLADLVLGSLLQNAAFKADLTAAKAELAQP